MNLLDSLFGNKAATAPKAENKDATLNAVMSKPQDDWTAEDRKVVTSIASNWGECKHACNDRTAAMYERTFSPTLHCRQEA